jgi:3',5'-cyclic AMP phosphodiesterase CpdA
MPGSRVQQVAGEAVLIREMQPLRSTQLRLSLDAPQAGARVFEVRPPATRGAFRIGLLSDVQEAIDRFGDVVAKINEQRGLDFLLGAGDLTQQGSHSQLRRFESELQALQIPYYTTLGNHELGVTPSLYQRYFGRGSFHFEHRGVHFTLLDSASATIDPLVYDWLEGWGERGSDALHLVAMHIPPIDPIGVRNGSFASREEAIKLLGRLNRYGVDLTLYGHVHSYYRFENAGIPARISGGGGSIPERFDTIGRHFLVIDLDSAAQSFETHVVRVDPGD